MAKKIEDKPVRDYAIFFRSFYEMIQELPDEHKLEAYEAIIKYSLYGEEPNFKGLAKIVWVGAQPIIERSRTKWLNSLKGGAPKGNQNAKRKTPKSEEEVIAYFKEKGYKRNPIELFNYGESIGWECLNPKLSNWQKYADWWEKHPPDND